VSSFFIFSLIVFFFWQYPTMSHVTWGLGMQKSCWAWKSVTENGLLSNVIAFLCWKANSYIPNNNFEGLGILHFYNIMFLPYTPLSLNEDSQKDARGIPIAYWVWTGYLIQGVSIKLIQWKKACFGQESNSVSYYIWYQFKGKRLMYLMHFIPCS